MSERDQYPRVLICSDISSEVEEFFQGVAEISVRPDITEDEIKQEISNFEAIMIRSRHQIDQETIDLGVNLKVIGQIGANLNNLDIAAAKHHGIEVVNSPDARSVAIAEHTLALMLASARQLNRINWNLKQGQAEPQSLVGTGLSGKTLGIIGFARIGREVAKRAQAFGMTVLVNQVRLTPELEIEDIEPVDLVDLLQRSDFVSIHVPSNENTAGLIGEEELALMKSSATLINTTRRETVNDEALLKALNEGRIQGAALDVFDRESAATDPLVQHEKVIATPYIAGKTEDAIRVATLSVAEQISEILQLVEVENVLPLKVVPMSKIIPHESIDQKRVDKLKSRLVNESILANPPIVTELEDGRFMVLDGATRTAALKQLGYPHTVVQVSSPEVGLDLHTWYHVIRNLPEEKLFDTLNRLENISLVSVDAERADDDMFEYGALCYVQTTDLETFLVQPTPGVNRLDALNSLTETYISLAVVDRTLEKEMRMLRVEYPDITALVVFPEYTVSQVMQVTLSGRYFPAGITRFIIPGRILRVKADLNVLKSSMPLHEKNRWLRELLEQKVQSNSIRYYREPVYLLDE